jgi:hypothetical protein
MNKLERLDAIQESSKSPLMREVASNIIELLPFSLYDEEYSEEEREEEREEELRLLIRDIIDCGCVSGCVPSMIYSKDTHTFFNKHYSEIEEIRIEFEEQKMPIKIGGDYLKNRLSWTAFEETVRRIAHKIGIEI